MKVTIKKSSLSGDMTIPGSKSQTIRAVLMSMLADGTSVIHNPLPSSDGLSAYSAATALGAQITREPGRWIVRGTAGQPRVPASVIDTGNSGTTTSFVTGICSLLEGSAEITGDEQIQSRPVRPEIEALAELGAAVKILRPGSDCPPVRVGGRIHGGVCHVPGYNSQHVSGILVPGALVPAGESVTIEVADPKEASYIQLTIDWMKKFGVTAEASADGRRFSVQGGQRYRASEVTVSGDWSGVAFPLVAAVCTDSRVTIHGADFDDPQGDKRVVQILRSMGADIRADRERGTLEVYGGRPLHGITIDMDDIPDALPALTVAACRADGETHFTTLAHIRVKESDRVAVMQEELSRCGADVSCSADDMVIRGGRPLHGAAVNCHKDHRVAMAMAVCGMMADGTMEIDGAECADVSFPGFYELFASAGAHFVCGERMA